MTTLAERIRTIISDMPRPKYGKQARLARIAGTGRQAVNDWLSIALHIITDWRRDQRRHEHLLCLESEYSIPDFLLPPDPQLPPRPPAEIGKKSPTPVYHIVTPDMEIIIFSDGQQLKIPRSRKGRL